MMMIYYGKVKIQENFFNIFDLSGIFMDLYAEVMITALSALLRTLFWFVIIVVAYGWQIHIAYFSRTELRNFVTVFITLYLLIFFDKIIEQINGQIWRVKIVYLTFI